MMGARTESLEHYCLFDTAIGPCGIAWNERGVARLQLPESDRSATEKRLHARSAGRNDPPPPIQEVIADIQRYFAGERIEFSSVAIDLTNAEPFHREVYQMARSLGWGQTASYGELARKVGTPDARAVGQALARNPIPIIVPCHRILASGNRVGGFSAYGGTLTKKWLLALEGAGAPLLPGMLPMQR